MIGKAIKYLRDRKERRERRVMDRLREEARKRIQVMEHDGRLWLSIDGLPVMPASLIDVPLERALAECREAYARAKRDGL